LTFVESGKNQFPEATVDTGAAVLAQSDIGIVAISDRFSDRFKMPDLNPTFVVDAAVALSLMIVAAVDAAIRRADADTDEKADQLRLNAALASNLRPLVQAPAALASSLAGVYRGFTDLGSPGRSAIDELQVLRATLDAFTGVDETTSHRRRESQNQAALEDINRRTAAVEMARVSTGVDLVSSADASALRDELDEVLDAEIVIAGDNGDDAVFAEIRALRAKVVQDLDARGARLPALQTFRVPATLPALVIASRLYDNPLRDAEIVARNGIRSPGFIRSQLDLEVLAE
jgi:prophage DNA circulation protein